MHFSTLHLAAFALAALSPIAVRAGNTYFTMSTPSTLSYDDSINLTWEAESSTETYELGLAQGPINNLSPVTVINGGYEPGTSYTWSALEVIPAGTYAFYIQQKSSGAINYSPFFCLQECSSTTSISASSFSTIASSTPSPVSTTLSTTPSSAASIAATVTASSAVAPDASGNVSGTAQYYNASSYGSTVEGSGNVMEFTGGAMKAGMMGVGAMVAVVAGGVAMMMV